MRLLDEFGQLQNSDSNQRVLRSSKLLTHGTRIAVMRFLSIVSRCVLVGFRPLVRTAVIAVTMALAGTVLNRPCLGENSVRLTTRLVTARQMQRSTCQIGESAFALECLKRFFPDTFRLRQLCGHRQAIELQLRSVSEFLTRETRNSCPVR